jgi:hypothetical protein
MENRSITSAYSPQHTGHKPPTTLLILFEIISLPVLARFSWRRGNKLLFWGLIAVMVAIAAMYFLMFRDVSLRPA